MSCEKHKAGLAVDCIKLEQTPIEKAIWSVLDEYRDAEKHSLKEWDFVCDVLQKVEEAVSKCTFEQLADFLIAHGVTVQEWISVKDRLPDKRGEYLCYYKFEPDSPDVVCENTYQGGGLWLSEKDKVTHWMKKPQPPKGE